jgi:hypothetical protein
MDKLSEIEINTDAPPGSPALLGCIVCGAANVCFGGLKRCAVLIFDSNILNEVSLVLTVDLRSKFPRLFESRRVGLELYEFSLISKGVRFKTSLQSPGLNTVHNSIIPSYDELRPKLHTVDP